MSMKIFARNLIIVVFVVMLLFGPLLIAEEGQHWKPQILDAESKEYLPDFSYAGYYWGEKALPNLKANVDVTDYGAIPNDGKDDTEAIQRAIVDATSKTGTVVLHFPPGKFIVTQIIFIKRSNFVLQGSGSGDDGTVLFMPLPLKDMKLPESFQKIKKDLIKKNKRVNDKLYSLFSWSGGILWTKLPKGHSEKKVISNIKGGERGGYKIKVETTKGIKPGETLEIQWFNIGGKKSSLLKHVIGNHNIMIGKFLYENLNRPLIRQPITVMELKDNLILIKEPLLHDLRPQWAKIITTVKYLENIGIEYLKLEFPQTKYGGHHLEDGYNAIFLTELAHSWVRDVWVHNADAAILSSKCKNVTIDGITVTGRTGHYSVHLGGSYGMLTTNFRFDSNAKHNPSFNTGAKLCVYSHGNIRQAKLDQHCGLNHQNLFDDIEVETTDNLFAHGGSGDYYPVAGLYNTFWNIRIKKPSGRGFIGSCNHAPEARLIGIVGINNKIRLSYKPAPYIEGLNKQGIAISSLYQYQLERRMSNKALQHTW